MKNWINSKALDSFWSLIQSLKTYDFHQKIIENFPGELFERTYQRVHIFRLKLNSSLLLPFIRIEYVMTITVCSMATKPQDWHPIRVHCCVKQYKISPQVLFKTKNPNGCFQEKSKRRMHANNSQCLDQITFRKKNSIKITPKDAQKLYLSTIQRNAVTILLFSIVHRE